MGSQLSHTEREFIPRHPYFPQDAEIPDYKQNETPAHILIVSFASIIGIILISTLLLARNHNRRLGLSDQAIFVWFVLCGSLHCFFEGYFITHHDHLASLQTLPAQLWKEYALSDSRYLTSDPFTLSVEGITVVLWGPICYTIAVCIARGNSSLRHPLQIIICMAHLYGVALYYMTCEVHYHLHGNAYSRPEPLYYWVYYFGMNAPWAVIPFFILWSSFREIQKAFAALDKVETGLRSSRSLDKSALKSKKMR